ncbi:UNKNOWN [Stylonychia lemnae]|uniref:Uncharacterized protein n=1 Tax=Stylonychia lemnae TaxID=5949 RepID=A0A078AME0_STYLE|nr:UNKNOWN [Stylonychia lemnae]|eukprot:CDW82018.1 UNKNOWN [Stylonychia lemnae]
MSSFGKATRGTSLAKQTQLPGPGNYNGDLRKATPAYSIGRGIRSSSKALDAPGPGQYQTIQSSQKGITMGMKTSFGGAMGSLGKNGQNPGPGQYQSNYESKAAAYTFGVKNGSTLDNSKNIGQPGPGQYNIGGGDPSQKHSHNNSRGPGFGTEKRGIGGVTKSATEIPGPGQYSLDHNNLGPKVGFGTSTRDKGGIKSDSRFVPGPGQYSHDDTLGKSAAKVSMKFRPNTQGNQRSLDIPGPGQYNPNLSSVKSQTPGSKIGTGQRNGLTSKDGNLPGPGHFSIGDDWGNKKKHAGFGSSNRGALSMSRDGPGPGNYNPTERTLSTAPQYTMGGGGQRSKAGRTDQPGPGQYNPKVDCAKENLGGVKIGTSPRGQRRNNDAQPGPGNYNVTGRLGGPAYGIGSGSRSNAKKEQTPGPGHYKLPVYVASLPRYQMPDKPENLRYV